MPRGPWDIESACLGQTEAELLLSELLSVIQQLESLDRLPEGLIYTTSLGCEKDI